MIYKWCCCTYVKLYYIILQSNFFNRIAIVMAIVDLCKPSSKQNDQRRSWTNDRRTGSNRMIFKHMQNWGTDRLGRSYHRVIGTTLVYLVLHSGNSGCGATRGREAGRRAKKIYCQEWIRLRHIFPWGNMESTAHEAATHKHSGLKLNAFVHLQPVQLLPYEAQT